ncbi:MAG: hypothetical protein KDE55_16160 [Novosphingobium sp.]|nr:hypothetical protein [Novosphingobium sp.]
MRKMTAIAAVALLSGCGGGGEVASVSKPMAQLTQCPALTPLASQKFTRSKAVPLPADPLGTIMASSRQQLAVTSLAGGTSCVDVRMMNNLEGFRLQQGDRYLSFGWQGYQDQGYRTDGHKLIDRSTGRVVETGGWPVFSPSGQMFASAYQSETAFAEINGFGVWRVTTNGPIPVAVVDDLPEMLDWRVDSWGSESCVNLSAVSFSSVPVGTKDFSSAPRERYVAKQTGASWQVDEADGKSCPAG